MERRGFVAIETLLRKLFRMLRLRGPIPVQPAGDRQRLRLFVVIDEAKILSLGGGERDRADNAAMAKRLGKGASEALRDRHQSSAQAA
jgi:hypothetical protein